MNNYIAYLVHHYNDLYKNIDAKIIGIFDSVESAGHGIEEAVKLKGFQKLPDNFNTTMFVLNRTHWQDGFETTADFPNSLVNDVISEEDLPIRFLKVKEVYCLTHFYDVEDDEEIRYIGIYTTNERAEEVLSELKLKPGFAEHPEDFNIDRFTLNEREWKEGFISWEEAME
ncbi:hypothetical protein D3C87_228160 [compost metagenome]